jgi:hypothetical protein
MSLQDFYQGEGGTTRSIKKSLLHELSGFHPSKQARSANYRVLVTGFERDKAAAVAGLTLRCNNGLVEGKVNKLKLIKKMEYD